MKRIARWLTLFLLATLLPASSPGQAQPTGQKPAAAIPKRTTSMTTDPALLHPSTLTAKAPAAFDVKFTTTRGDFTIHVNRDWAPLGADRFYNLVHHHFYDDAAFFRVVPNFVVQFGLNANPQVNKAWQSANIKDDPVTQSNKRGFLTFATAGPNTRTTQLFINLGDNSSLDRQGFAPFGQITQGMEVVFQIYSGYGEAPNQEMITNQGKAYLDKNFPKLDHIVSATIVAPAPAK